MAKLIEWVDIVHECEMLSILERLGIDVDRFRIRKTG